MSPLVMQSRSPLSVTQTKSSIAVPYTCDEDIIKSAFASEQRRLTVSVDGSGLIKECLMRPHTPALER